MLQTQHGSASFVRLFGRTARYAARVLSTGNPRGNLLVLGRSGKESPLPLPERS